MYYKQKADIIFRDYESFGYITDNRNFGYRKLRDNEEVIGDKILSKSGSAFFSILEKSPLSLDELIKRAHNLYTDVDIELLKNDLQGFYDILVQDGFIVSGKTLTECNDKDIKFSYSNYTNEKPRKRLPIMIQKKHTQDFFDEYFKGLPQLTSVHIEITSKCNERCVHCYIPHENKMNDMSPVIFTNILNQCIRLNVLHITISGGEPMINKHFCSFLNELNNNDFSVSVLSNLTLLNDEIINELKANPLLGVQVSLYSMKPNIHDQITKLQGSFENTTSNILKLVENDIPVQITCPIIRQNKDCYKDVITWAKEHNIEATSDPSIMARYDHTTSNLCNRLLPTEVKKILHDKIEEDPQYLVQLINEAQQKKASNPNDIACSICHSSV
ncbi:MAG TPA: radical SAM protein, partial [Bacteroidales bacterium]|nr:radical SAM protein [Bacteroidales bacterium]